MQDVNNKEKGCGGIYGNSAIYAQFSCKPKTNCSTFIKQILHRGLGSNMNEAGVLKNAWNT